MDVLLRSKLLLTFVVIILAIIFSEILVYTQVKLFWPDVDKIAIYNIGFWTPLIDAFFVVVGLLYLRSVYEKELQEKNKILVEAKEIANIAEWELNIDTMKASWSKDVIKMFGLPENTIENGPSLLESLMYKEDWDRFENSMSNCILGKQDHKCLYRIRKKNNNKTIWVECRGKLDKSTNKIRGTVQDITELKKAEKKIDNYLDLINDNIITSTTDLDGKITSVSKAFCEISGYTQNELLGQNHRIIKHPDMDVSIYENLWNTIKKNNTWKGELKNLKKDGSAYWVEATIYPIFEDEKKIGYTAIRQNITDKKIIEEISVTDGLTGIFNRRHFNETFPKVINSAKRTNDVVYFLILDVDNFKLYNDTYGHQKGDEALINVANTIKKTIKRADDYCFRLGGEEFGVIFKADSNEKAIEFANKIKDTIENLNIIHEKNTCSKYITVSIGLYFKNALDIENSDELYKNADDLLYKAKKEGRNKVCSPF